MWNRSWWLSGINITSFYQRRYSGKQLWLNMVTNSFRVIRLIWTNFTLSLILIIYQITFWTRCWTCSLMICIWNLDFIQLKFKWSIPSGKSNRITNFRLKYIRRTNFFFFIFLLQHSFSHQEIRFLLCRDRNRVSRSCSRCFWNYWGSSSVKVSGNCCSFLIKLYQRKCWWLSLLILYIWKILLFL